MHLEASVTSSLSNFPSSPSHNRVRPPGDWVVFENDKRRVPVSSQEITPEAELLGYKERSNIRTRRVTQLEQGELSQNSSRTMGDIKFNNEIDHQGAIDAEAKFIFNEEEELLITTQTIKQTLYRNSISKVSTFIVNFFHKKSADEIQEIRICEHNISDDVRKMLGELSPKLAELGVKKLDQMRLASFDDLEILQAIDVLIKNKNFIPKKITRQGRRYVIKNIYAIFCELFYWSRDLKKNNISNTQDVFIKFAPIFIRHASNRSKYNDSLEYAKNKIIAAVNPHIQPNSMIIWDEVKIEFLKYAIRVNLPSPEKLCIPFSERR